MKKAFVLIMLLALALTGCDVAADVTDPDVTDPTDNSYQTYPTTITPTQTDPTKETVAEGTTVPTETEGKINEKETSPDSDAVSEPTAPPETVPGKENVNHTEGPQETTPPKQPEPTQPVQPPTETIPTIPTEPEAEPTQPPAVPTVPPTDPPETKPSEPVETEPKGCSHNWECVHHAEEGHWRAGVVCDCGWTAYGSAEALIALWNEHSASFPAAESLFDHGGYGCVDEWIVDTPAYDEWVCRQCGEKKK